MNKICYIFLILIILTLPTTAQNARQNTLLRSGPMLGYSEMTETVVWLQTRQPTDAQIRYWKQGEPKNVKFSKTVRTNEETDFIARFTLSQLDFGARYDYDVFLNGKRIAFDYQPTFQTQQHWRWRTEPPAFRFAFGSCSYINDPPFDRPGKPYGSNFEIFNTIAAKKPDFMIWMGDNVYYREPDWLAESAMRYRFRQNRELPELQRLLASTHNYAIWDDHDYGPNDSDRTFRLREAALRVFKDYWANATYGEPDAPGVFGRFEWADVEFFLLDNRFYRSPEKMPNSPDKVMFGERQMRWLTESMRSSTATFKIVVGGNQMLNQLSPVESFKQFPAEQRRLLDFIRDARIEGVLFLSGDRHYSELIRLKDVDSYPLYDFTSSPLTAGNADPYSIEENNPDRVRGTLVKGIKSFGMIEVAGTAKARKLILRAFDSTGKELWKHEISAAELKFPKQ
ncbi:MAG: alkaline phosphatase family protein [Acidobacteriota bacterium]|nr:alkaline phosphatase family protein [Acidobacteriota bacterium]